jgi:hypothetical protein
VNFHLASVTRDSAKRARKEAGDTARTVKRQVIVWHLYTLHKSLTELYRLQAKTLTVRGRLGSEKYVLVKTASINSLYDIFG